MSALRGSRRLKLATIGTAALLAAGSFVMIQAVSAEAGGATRYVAPTGSDTDNDCTDISNPCETIQHAVDEANTNDTVSIAAGTYDESVHIRFGLTVVGAGTSGANRTTIDGFDGDTSVIIDGTDVESTPTVTLSQLDISGNSDSDGVDVNRANAIVRDSVVSNNNNSGILIDSGSTLNVTDSSLDGNGDSGVGINGSPTTDRADVSPSAVGDTTATITRSDVSGNAQGIQAEEATVTVNSSTVNDNLAGGAVMLDVGTLTLNSSTLDGNHTIGTGSLGGTVFVNSSTISNTFPSPIDEEAGELGAGVLGVGATIHVNQSTVYKSTNDGIVSVSSTITVKNSTVVGTRKVSGGTAGLARGALAVGAISVPGPEVQALARGARTITPKDLPSSEFDVSGTLLAGNAVPACTDGITDAHYNLSDDDSCSFGSTGKNDATAKLGSFGSHGGPTDTLVPAKGSDAIDQIPAGQAGCVKAGLDQRGFARLQGAKCDIGSVEVKQSPIVVSPSTLPTATVGKAYSVTFTATGGLGAPYEFFLAPGAKLPNGMTLTSAGVLSGTPTLPGTYKFTLGVDDPSFFVYTLVVVGSGPTLADTGARVAPMVTIGGVAVGLGVLLLLAAGRVGGYTGRRRRMQ